MKNAGDVRLRIAEFPRDYGKRYVFSEVFGKIRENGADQLRFVAFFSLHEIQPFSDQCKQQFACRAAHAFRLVFIRHKTIGDFKKARAKRFVVYQRRGGL